MKIIKPSHEIMISTSPYKHIERIGRICYKSEDAITETSAIKFVHGLLSRNHQAMIEHFRFIAVIDDYDYDLLAESEYNKYITFSDYGRRIISMSARGINDMYHKLLYAGGVCNMNIVYILKRIAVAISHKYDCRNIFDTTLLFDFPYKPVQIIDSFDELNDREYDIHAWYSVRLVCDRGVTHELVRHRDASFAQESTRYCNYNKDKYGNEITVIKPVFWEEDSEQYQLWWKSCKYLEGMYMQLIHSGAKPQEARSILPNSLKTEIVVTAQVYEWKHIFNLRVKGTTGAPHPQIKEVMEPVYKEMKSRGYIRCD